MTVGKIARRSVLAGVALTRMGRPRLVDILNDTKQPFIALFGADELQIVNRALIAHARPIS